nr:cation diffusion facilitator family transporter [Tautonia sociabilis]
MRSHERRVTLDEVERVRNLNTAARGIRAAQAGLMTNVGLVLVKLIAGIVGNTYALIADAVESSVDIFSSLIVWGGLSIASRPADEHHPFGHGRAEALAEAAVSLMLLGAACGIAIVAVREIVTPHQVPAPFTLAVAGGVILVKEALFRKVFNVGAETGSTAVKADAWHHRSDAITSAAAFLGIGVALWGGPGWESADDYAALVAAAFIAANGLLVLRPTIHDLMDRTPEGPVVAQVAAAAAAVPGVRAVEKLKMRKLGMEYYVDIHVQADPLISLRDAHTISGKVKHAIREAVPVVSGASIHMEPFEEAVPNQADGTGPRAAREGGP